MSTSTVPVKRPHTCAWGSSNVLDFDCPGCLDDLHTGGFDDQLRERLEWAQRSAVDANPAASAFTREGHDSWYRSLRGGQRVAMYREGTISQFVGMKAYLRWDNGEHDVVAPEDVIPCLAGRR